MIESKVGLPWLDRLRAVPAFAAAATVFLALAVASAMWALHSEKQQREVLRAQARLAAETSGHALQLTLAHSVGVLDVLRVLVQQGHGQVPQFEGIAAQLLASRPDILAMGLLPGGVLDRMVSAQAPSEAWEGVASVGAHLHAGALLAVQEQRRVVSEPAVVPSGGLGLVVHEPVHLIEGDTGPSDGPWWGAVRIAIGLPALLDAARLDRIVQSGFHYELRAPVADTAGRSTPDLVLASSLAQGEALVTPLEIPVQLNDLRWTLAVVPVGGWLGTADLYARLWWAFLFSAGMSGAVYLLLQRMQLTRSLLSHLTNHVPGALYQYRRTPDGQTAFTYFSSGVEALTGLSVRSLRQSDRGWNAQVLPEDRVVLLDALRQSARDLSPLEVDFRMRLPDGQVRWFWTQAQPLRQVDGTVVWNGYLADWSDEKRTEEALAESSKLLTEAQEVARLGYFVTDVASGCWTSSALLDDIYGIGPDYPRTSAGWKALVGPEFRKPLQMAYQQAVVARSGFNVEYAVHRPLDGSLIWVNAIGRLEFDGQGRPTRIVGTVQDITARKKAEADIRSLAYYDSLTGLPNRRLLLDRLSQALGQRRLDHSHGALLYVDLDNFKHLNDAMGYATGDALLGLVAQRLLGCVRDVDTVARLSGDEFVLLLSQLALSPDEDPVQVAEKQAQRVIAALAQPYTLAGGSHTSTPSVGIALFSDEGLAAEEVIKRADVAMYQAKAAGRHTWRFFDPAIQARVAERLQMAEDLRLAMAGGQLFLQYQPQHDDTGRLIGAEALLRWRHPQRGLVSPGVFVPLAEQMGLMVPLGQWVLAAACQQLGDWLADTAMALQPGRFTLAVNVSAHQFRNLDFADSVGRVMQQWRIPPGVLKLELTESLMVHDVEDIIATMNAMRAWGVLFSLDDFGTGYSSLALLKRLPLDQLKIDQSFVRDVIDSTNDAAIARTVVALGQSLALDVIAEGVETEAQRAFLLSMGCLRYQGYLFSKPLSVEDFRAYTLSGIQ